MGNNAVERLRQICLEQSTRPFKARGSAVLRCPDCLLANFACLCPWRINSRSAIQFVLIMHRDEVYKSTNSGRLIADLFPDNTVAYLWSRTEPEPQLLAHLHNPKRQLRLLFPESSAMVTEENTESFIDNRPLTVVLIDGTWKQAGRIVRLSPWLSHLPRMSIQADAEQSGLYIRKALHSHQLSTAQSAACVLAQAGEADNATLLNQYFSVFNQHCIATRRGVAPTLTEAHHFLSARQSQTDSSLPSITQQGSIQLSNYQSRNPE